VLRINRFLYFGSLRRSSTLIFRIWTCIVLATSDSLVTNVSVPLSNLIVHFLMQNNGQLVYKSMSSFAFTPQSFISDCGVSSSLLYAFIPFTYAVTTRSVLIRVSQVLQYSLLSLTAESVLIRVSQIALTLCSSPLCQSPFQQVMSPV
jgi:ACR3 family arsenite efflux pump ArsB